MPGLDVNDLDKAFGDRLDVEMNHERVSRDEFAVLRVWNCCRLDERRRGAAAGGTTKTFNPETDPRQETDSSCAAAPSNNRIRAGRTTFMIALYQSVTELKKVN
jgi:hypothetical protein